MIESKKFNKIEQEFMELHTNINQDDRSNQEICYLFEQALENIKKRHLEIAMFILSVIIESIASRKNYEEFKTFDLWLIENEERLKEFIEEIKGSSSPKEIIKKWHEQYRETYGPRKNFVKIVIDSYKTLNKIPSFMWLKTKIIKGVKTSTYRTEGYNDINKLFEEFEKEIKKIYDKYRSPFAHQGKFLDFGVRIQTKVGGPSFPGSISLQDLSLITLNLMKVNLTISKTENVQTWN